MNLFDKWSLYNIYDWSSSALFRHFVSHGHLSEGWERDMTVRGRNTYRHEKKCPYVERGMERRTGKWQWPEQRFKIENGNFWQVSIRHEYNCTVSDDPSAVYGNMYLPAIKHFPACSAQSLSLPLLLISRLFFSFCTKVQPLFVFSFKACRYISLYKVKRNLFTFAIPCYRTCRNTVPHIYTPCAV
jgi:hypothetical protein